MNAGTRSRARDLGFVFAGGTFGTLARYTVALAAPTSGDVPATTFGINVAGAFVLGWLIEALTHHGDDIGWRRSVRLFAGTGILGGFTTYSALAVDTDGLLIASHPGLGALYALATVVVGAAASLAGIGMGAITARRRAS